MLHFVLLILLFSQVKGNVVHETLHSSNCILLWRFTLYYSHSSPLLLGNKHDVGCIIQILSVYYINLLDHTIRRY